MKVESMTMRLSEHGRDVLLLERSSLGRYAIIKGTPDKMLDHLLDKEVIDEKGEEGSKSRGREGGGGGA